MPEGFDDFLWTGRRGDPKHVTFTVRTDAEPDGANITAWGKTWITGKFRLSQPDAQALFQITDDPGGAITTTDADTGQQEAVLPLDDADVLTRLPNRLVTIYVDIQKLDPEGNVRTLSSGTLVIYPEVTLAVT